MASDDIHTIADPAAARDLALQVFTQNGFTATPTSEYSVTVERGSKSATMLLGAFSGKKQHIRYDLQVMAAPDAPGAIVRIVKGTTGAAAGAIGVSRANKAYQEWAQQVYAVLPR